MMRVVQHKQELRISRFKTTSQLSLSAPIFLIVATTVATDNEFLCNICLCQMWKSPKSGDLIQYTWEPVLLPPLQGTILRLMILDGNDCCFIGIGIAFN